LAAYGQRVRKIKSSSASALAKLFDEGARFDLAHVDGSHSRDDVIVDCLLAWPMLRPGGLMILDDYELDLDKKATADRPTMQSTRFSTGTEGNFTNCIEAFRSLSDVSVKIAP